MARVPLARKNLFHDRRRAFLAVVGVGLSLVLVLVLDGIFAGAMRQVTAYVRHSPADLFVAQEDVRTMHMTESVLPEGAVGAVRDVPGVAWAEGLRYTTGTVDSGSDARLTYVFGYDTSTGRGGPARMAAGRSPGPGEVVVDSVAADELDVEVGDTVLVLGSAFRVSGLSADGTNIVNTTVYLRGADFAAVRPGEPAFVLVGGDPSVDARSLAARIDEEVAGVTTQTRAEFIHREGKVVRDMAADVMTIMTVIGFLIALAVVGLTLMSTTLARLREYGILKALGGRTARLTATVLGQAVWSVALGLAVALVVSWAVGRGVAAATPNVRLLIEPAAVVRVGVGALFIGAIAAIIPLRRVLRVDPATSFRRA